MDRHDGRLPNLPPPCVAPGDRIAMRLTRVFVDMGENTWRNNLFSICAPMGGLSRRQPHINVVVESVCNGAPDYHRFATLSTILMTEHTRIVNELKAEIARLQDRLIEVTRGE